MIRAAVEAAKKAGKLLKADFGKPGKAFLKSNKDFTTQSDLNSEKEIIKILKRRCPGYNILSEESGWVSRGSAYTWLIDPLCSSNNFTFGLIMYGLSIALLREGAPLMGVIYLPELDFLFTAEKGKGACLNGKRIRVSKRDRLANALFLYDNQFHKEKNMHKNFRRLSDRSFTLRITGSAAFDLCLLAMGSADARIFNRTKPCDFMAGGLIVEEAGGAVTNFQGKRFSLRDSSIVASNGIIHHKILSILK